ncbi:MAG: hypothetical protein CVT92_00315 [Bacteroidetes bacterium HGW-Bacteroidetes-1]|nr:MAG: hypothetical protein CVT92_00315 [Bacteroidetes bacterium HGW-Bacteroidetes-1]
MKSRVELEDFSGKTARAVKQDFFAKVFLLTLCAAYAHPIEEKVLAEYRSDDKRKHPQKINRTNALSMTQDILIGVVIKQKYKQALEAFDKIVASTREIICPGRSFKRKKRPEKTYSMNYKRL